MSLEELRISASRFSAEAIVYCVLLYFCSWIISVYKWRLLLPNFSFGRLLSVSFVGQFYSTVLPGQIAGEVAKAYRLGKGRQDAEHVAASVLVDKLTGLIGLLMVAASGLFASNSRVPLEIPLSIIFFASFFLISLFCLKIPLIHRILTRTLEMLSARWPLLEKLVLRIFRLLDAWEQFLTNPFRLIYVFFLGALFQLICVWINILLAQDLGISIPFSDWCWIFGLVSIAVLLPISVGGIGVREGAFAGALSLQGVPIEKSIALSLAVFAISLLGTLMGGLLEVFNSRRFRTFYMNIVSSVSIDILPGIEKKTLQTGGGNKHLPTFLPFYHRATLLCRLTQRFLSSKHRISYKGKL